MRYVSKSGEMSSEERENNEKNIGSTERYINMSECR